MKRKRKLRAFSFGFWSLPACALACVKPDGSPDDPIEDPEPAAGGAGGDPPAPPVAAQSADAIPKYTQRQMNDAIRRRKKAESGFRMLVAAIGGDPELVEIVQKPNTRQGQNPEYEIRGLEETIPAFAANPPSSRPAAAQQNAQSQARLNKLQKQNDALRKHLVDLAMVQPIRSACVRQHAIDDDGGLFEDIVNALRPRLRERFEDAADDSGDLVVFVDVIDPKTGEPQFNANGDALTPEDLVKDVLTKKPKFREAEHRATGPGAGQQNRPAPTVVTGGRAGVPAGKLRSALDQAWGVKIPDAAVQ